MPATHSLDLEKSSSQYAFIADASAPNLEISGSQTWEAWFKTEDLTTNNQHLIAKYTSGTIKRIFIRTTGFMNCSLAGLSGTDNVESSRAFLINIWYHVAMVYSSVDSKLYLYINGELDNSVSASGSATDTNGEFAIGRLGGTGGTNHFDGLIRNVRVWNVARTQQEIRDNMNIDTPSGTGLQGNWILNNAYTDSSGNGYTLTPSGSPVFSTTYPDAINLTENGAFTKKHKIVVQASQVPGSTDLTDVPIVLTESNFFSSVFDNTINGGADLRFSTDSSGKTRLAHEVVSWDTSAKTGEVWVKANTLGATTNTPIYVHYKNPTASALDENEAFGKHQVYVSNYKASYKLLNTIDSTSNSRDLTNTNSVVFTTGKTGLAADLGTTNVTNKKLEVSSNLGITTGNITMFCWGYIAARTASYKDPFMALASGTIEYRLHITNTGVVASRHIGLVSFEETTEFATNLDTWYFLTLTYNTATSTLSLYVDGQLKHTKNTSGTGSTIGNYFAVGNSSQGNNLRGKVDSAFVYSGLLTADEIQTLYNNQNNPATFAIPQSTAGGAFLLQFV
jgi:hypothetical protein